MPNQVATTNQQQTTVRQFIESNEVALANAIPEHLSIKRFIRVALTEIHKTPKLGLCTRDSLISSLLDAAAAGLSVDGFSGEAYLIPYGTEAVLVPGYKGLTKLARQSGEILTLTHNVVRKGDEWEYRKEPAKLTHNPKVDFKDQAEADSYYKDDTILGAFVKVELTNGGLIVDYWPLFRLIAHGKKYSPAFAKGKKDCCWIAHLEIACRKTVLRSMIARAEIPVSADLISMATKEEAAEKANAIVDANIEPPVTNLNDLTSQLLQGDQGNIEGPDDDAKTEPPKKPKSKKGPIPLPPGEPVPEKGIPHDYTQGPDFRKICVNTFNDCDTRQAVVAAGMRIVESIKAKEWSVPEDWGPLLDFSKEDRLDQIG